MIASVKDSLDKVEGHKKTCDDEVAKLWEELHKEKALRKETWNTLEDERRVHEEDLQSEKASFNVALEEERGLRGAAETRIQALECELKDANTKLKKTEPISTRLGQRSARL